ncbi:hypothetical protein T439DRAFT_327949 [Meredithblackwellia eburnea MCA 4105]
MNRRGSFNRPLSSIDGSSTTTATDDQPRRPSYQALFVQHSPTPSHTQSLVNQSHSQTHTRRSSASTKHRSQNSVYYSTGRRLTLLTRHSFLRSRATILFAINFIVLFWIFFRSNSPTTNPTTTTSSSPAAANEQASKVASSQAEVLPPRPPVVVQRNFTPTTIIKHVPNPATESCEVCIVNPEDPLCEYGIDNIRLSRSYEGSGYRVRRVVDKALRGEEIKIGIIGASVTAGHGIEGHRKWQEQFLADWIKMFPKTKMFNGAAPGMNSDFFSYCFDAILPKNLDLYIVELDINNDAVDATYHHDDALYRGLLNLPQEPAVIRVSVFALLFPDLARGMVSNLIMSQFHDIPIINIRNFLLPHLFQNPNDTSIFFSKSWGEIDTRHISHHGHKAMGDMLALYMRQQVCESKRRKLAPPKPRHNIWPTDSILGKVPSQYIWTTFNAKEKVLKLTPSCSLVGSTLRPLVPLPPIDQAWHLEEWNGKSALGSFTVGSTVKFSFTGTKVGIFVWSSNGAKNVIKPGRARCGVDGEWGRTVDAWIDEEFAHSRWNLLEEGLAPGEHILTCEILEATSSGGHDFRILGIGQM